MPFTFRHNWYFCLLAQYTVPCPCPCPHCPLYYNYSVPKVSKKLKVSVLVPRLADSSKVPVLFQMPNLAVLFQFHFQSKIDSSHSSSSKKKFSSINIQKKFQFKNKYSKISNKLVFLFSFSCDFEDNIMNTKNLYFLSSKK